MFFFLVSYANQDTFSDISLVASKELEPIKDTDNVSVLVNPTCNISPSPAPFAIVIQTFLSLADDNMFFYIFDRNDKANHNSTHKFWQKVVEASLIKATIVFYYYYKFFFVGSKKLD